MMGSFFNKVLTSAKNIYRWEGSERINLNNDAEHMWSVTIIADFLLRIQRDKFGYEINDLEVLRRALYHDVIEVETGDILSTVKKTTPEMKQMLSNIETLRFDSNIRPLIPEKYQDEMSEYILNPKNNLKTIEGQIIAVADKIDSLLEVIREVNKGNKTFVPYLQTESEALLDLNVECGLYFLKYSLLDFGISKYKFGNRVSKFIDLALFEEDENHYLKIKNQY